MLHVKQWEELRKIGENGSWFPIDSVVTQISCSYAVWFRLLFFALRAPKRLLSLCLILHRCLSFLFHSTAQFRQIGLNSPLFKLQLQLGPRFGAINQAEEMGKWKLPITISITTLSSLIRNQLSINAKCWIAAQFKRKQIEVISYTWSDRQLHLNVTILSTH